MIIPPTTVGVITGDSVTCIATTITLADTSTAGIWSSGATGIATVDASGVVMGVAAGTTTISYTVSGCGTAVAIRTITVNTVSPAGTISGNNTVCPSANDTLTETIPGGVWSSSATSIASIDPAGIVTGLTGGVTTISYSVINGCGTSYATFVVTVNLLPVSGTLAGDSLLCPLGTSTITSSVTGGSWSTTSPSVASISSSGVITAVAAGLDTVVYTVTNMCGSATANYTITIDPLPVAATISGNASLCVADTSTLLVSLPGGSWNSSIPGVANINSAGLVTGVSAGTTLITYTITNFCGSAMSTWSMTINTVPPAGTISGTTTLCPTSVATLSETVSGGTWATSNPAVVSVDVAGVVTAAIFGIDTIYYTLTNICGSATATFAITVNNTPSAGAISGDSLLCPTATSTLTPTLSGGSWSTSNSLITTVSGSGVLTAVGSGTDTAYYTVTGICGTATASYAVTVSALPVAGTISGLAAICPGDTTTYIPTIAGGIWNTSTTGIATVNASGNVTGVSSGVVMISYTVSNDCSSATTTSTLTISPLPDAGAISGLTSVCVSSAIVLSESVSGGSWSVINGNASVNPSGGVIGNVAGTDSIAYSVTNSCGTANAYYAITINQLPAISPISGDSVICQGSVLSLSDAASGGAWTATSSAIITVDIAGNVTGLSAGTGTVTYLITGICGAVHAFQQITVNPMPDGGVISGAGIICPGTSYTLSETVSGGTWSSSDTTIHIDASSVVMSYTSGSSVISYMITNSCGSATMTFSITSSALADAGSISGVSELCQLTSSSLTESLTTGTWSSADPLIASVASDGTVSGIAGGTTNIYYTVTNS